MWRVNDACPTPSELYAFREYARNKENRKQLEDLMRSNMELSTRYHDAAGAPVRADAFADALAATFPLAPANASMDVMDWFGGAPLSGEPVEAMKWTEHAPLFLEWTASLQVLQNMSPKQTVAQWRSRTLVMHVDRAANNAPVIRRVQGEFDMQDYIMRVVVVNAYDQIGKDKTSGAEVRVPTVRMMVFDRAYGTERRWRMHHVKIQASAAPVSDDGNALSLEQLAPLFSEYGKKRDGEEIGDPEKRAAQLVSSITPDSVLNADTALTTSLSTVADPHDMRAQLIDYLRINVLRLVQKLAPSVSEAPAPEEEGSHPPDFSQILEQYVVSVLNTSFTANMPRSGARATAALACVVLAAVAGGGDADKAYADAVRQFGTRLYTRFLRDTGRYLTTAGVRASGRTLGIENLGSHKYYAVFGRPLEDLLKEKFVGGGARGAPAVTRTIMYDCAFAYMMLAQRQQVVDVHSPYALPALPLLGERGADGPALEAKKLAPALKIQWIDVLHTRPRIYAVRGERDGTLRTSVDADGVLEAARREVEKGAAPADVALSRDELTAIFLEIQDAAAPFEKTPAQDTTENLRKRQLLKLNSARRYMRALGRQPGPGESTPSALAKLLVALEAAAADVQGNSVPPGAAQRVAVLLSTRPRVFHQQGQTQKHIESLRGSLVKLVAKRNGAPVIGVEVPSSATKTIVEKAINEAYGSAKGPSWAAGVFEGRGAEPAQQPPTDSARRQRLFLYAQAIQGTATNEMIGNTIDVAFLRALLLFLHLYHRDKASADLAEKWIRGEISFTLSTAWRANVDKDVFEFRPIERLRGEKMDAPSARALDPGPATSSDIIYLAFKLFSSRALPILRSYPAIRAFIEAITLDAQNTPGENQRTNIWLRYSFQKRSFTLTPAEKQIAEEFEPRATKVIDQK